MSRDSNSLLKKTLIYGVGTFGSKILTFLLVPLYSYYLNREEFGYFDLIITSINLIVPFISVQISDSIFRWLFSEKDDDFQKSKIISNGFAFFCFNAFIVLLISGLMLLFYPIKYQWLICFLTIASIFYPFMQQIARGLGKSKLFAMNGVLYTIIYLIGNIILLIVLKWNIQALFYSTLCGYIVASIFLFLRLKIWRYLSIRYIDLQFCKELLSYSLPLVPNTISWWLINSVNKYVIVLFLGVSYNGLFAMSNRFPVILVMINQIFTLAWQESAIQNFEKSPDLSKNTQVLENLIKIQFSSSIILSLMSQYLVSNLLSSEFFESWKYMPILYLSVSFLSFCGYYGAFYLGARKTREIFTTTIIAGTLNVFLAFIFVRFWGLMGISLATLCGYIALFLLRIKTVKEIATINFPISTFVKYGILVIIALVITYQSNLIYSVSGAVLMFLVIVYDNKGLIRNGIYTLKKNKF